MTRPEHDAVTPEPSGVDPFLDEVRALKREALDRAGGTLEGVFRHLREVEDLHRDRLVRSQPEAVSDGDPQRYGSGNDSASDR